ncbi:MFS transporter, DHA2 family, multidrug resistance protein [Actinopolymorpha cephalotaxi]|uniref:DHA2 family multidrug resistance protein-like MFS transporter n=1 Tax=Actinopolymorpha cephalotaxi TaxID=504797 RepID=A0A1I2LJL8_9ACTN|nr:MFS transporter [Actinopolymorpha cephalotaxi]NYH84880.1 DHA2 family multidrug resistance protein-like MFS transporter [Actinopolymorpha cephalotaxi]SFF78650.1 MFS transporter, DHA2 family, multidrug resistance protein [Actinopolymorpha cephalotaxi]
MTSQSTAPGPRASRREWIGLAVLALPTLLLSLDMSVLYLALPHMSEDLGATATQQLWIMDVYSFMIAGFLVTMGTLGDRIGRRRLLMIGGTAFAVASVLAAYSTSAEMLISTRALLGVAGATLMPSTLSLIGTMFRDQHQRGVAIAVWMTCFMVGMTVGPLVGGVLLQNFWWGSAFLLGVPVMALLLATAPALLPEFRDEQAGRIDLASVALSLATVLPAVYGLKELAHGGWHTGPALAVLVGLVFGVLFCRRQVHLDDPLLDLELFRSRRFSTALCMNFGGAIVMAGTFLLISQYLQLVAGMSPLRAGLATVPVNVAMAISSMLTPQLARRFRPAVVSAGGFALAALGLVVVALAAGGSAGSYGLAALLVGFALTSVGIAAPSALGVNLIVGAAPPTKAGAASGMSETSGELGVALGVATLGSIAAAFYVARVDVPAGVPAAAADAARESLPGAVVTAGGLPEPLAAALLGSARSAFTGGLAIAAVVGAVVLTAVAVVSGVMFRHLRSYGDEAAAASGAPASEPVDVDTTATPA